MGLGLCTFCSCSLAADDDDRTAGAGPVHCPAARHSPLAPGAGASRWGGAPRQCWHSRRLRRCSAARRRRRRRRRGRGRGRRRSLRSSPPWARAGRAALRRASASATRRCFRESAPRHSRRSSRPVRRRSYSPRGGPPRGASTGSEVRAQALLCDAAAAAPADAVDAQCPRTTGAPTAFTACRAAVTAALAGARPASRTPTRSAPPSTRCVRTAARQARRAQPMANARMGAAGADKCILAARGSLR